MLSQIAGLLALLWAGMILGISFLESWVKFRAPSLTKAIGFDVGKTVFSLFHTVQNIFLLCIISFSFIIFIPSTMWFVLSGILVSILLQFFYLFPKLCERANELIVGNTELNKSYVHMIYGITEIFKFILLLILGIQFMQHYYCAVVF